MLERQDTTKDYQPYSYEMLTQFYCRRTFLYGYYRRASILFTCRHGVIMYFISVFCAFNDIFSSLVSGILFERVARGGQTFLTAQRRRATIYPGEEKDATTIRQMHFDTSGTETASFAAMHIHLQKVFSSYVTR